MHLLLKENRKREKASFAGRKRGERREKGGGKREEGKAVIAGRDLLHEVKDGKMIDSRMTREEETADVADERG
jgi:hypothetical protein